MIFGKVLAVLVKRIDKIVDKCPDSKEVRPNRCREVATLTFVLQMDMIQFSTISPNIMAGFLSISSALPEE
jgi:hypothetical protein